MLPTDTKLEAQRNKKSSSHPQKASATTIEGNQRTGSLLRAAGNHEVICFLLSSYYFAELKISSEYVYNSTKGIVGYETSTGQTMYSLAGGQALRDAVLGNWPFPALLAAQR